MREIQFPLPGPKQRLLDAAEQLFAERGFEAVSVRDITKQSQANVAAVNYHFGSREQLIALAIARYLQPISEERLARLDTIEKKWAGKQPPLEEIIDAWARPLLAVARKSGLPEPLLCKLLGRIFTAHGDDFPQAAEKQLRQSYARFTRALAKSLPALAGEEIWWRLHFVAGGMIHLLLRQDLLHETSNGASGAPTLEATLGRFIRYAAAAMREGVEPDPGVAKGPQTTFDF